jgi:hypothetical protein
VPLRLDKAGSEACAIFTADYTGRYELYLDVERNLPSGDLMLLAVGTPDPDDKPAHPDLRRPDIVWSVTEEGEPKRGVLHWQPAAWSGTYWGETVGCQIGEFAGTAGRTYAVVTEVRKAAPPLQVMHPRLVISSSVRYRPEAYVLPSFLGIAGMIACVISLICLYVAFARWRKIGHRIS